MLKLFKELSKKELYLVIFVVILTCFQVYLDLTLPDYMSEITKLVQTQGSALDEIYSAGGQMMLCAFGSLGISVVVAVCAAKVSANFSYITRGRVFEKVMSFSMREVNSFSSASLITRTTNDITQVQTLIVMGTQLMIKAPLTAVWAMLKISTKNTSFTVATGVALVILMSIVGICLGRAIPKFKMMQTLTDNVNRVAKQRLDGLAVVRAYGAEDYENEKFEEVNQDITSSYLFVGRTMSFLMPSIQSISSGLTLAIYLLGASLINEAVGMDKLDIFSDMVVFSSYAMLIIMSFLMLCMVFMIYPRAAVSAKRILEVLETENTVVEGTITQGKPNMQGQVEFKNVSFRYPDAEDYVLKNISFQVNQGEVVAFIGSTGCGKSTLMNLIPRFYDATEGEVLISGVNVKEFEKDTLNGKIAYVSQRATLFTGTVKSNVAFGDNILRHQGREDLDQALETAQAMEFVQSLDAKEDAHVAQGGGNLSGGQKQRISIARAVYRDPEIFIFDDSFSALDYKTDRNLRETLHQECKDSTRLIIGQRIGTIKDADKIIVLEHGEIVGMGKHKELLTSCDVYHEIARSQLSEEELNYG